MARRKAPEANPPSQLSQPASFDLNAMTTFVMIARERSVSSAATALNLQKSTVSRQLDKLEERLGARLVQRSARGVSLTEAGEAFLRACTRVVGAADEAMTVVDSLTGQTRGHLKVTAPILFGEAFLPSILVDLLHEHADLAISVELTNRTVRPIEEDVDVAIKIGPPADASLVARKLRTLEPVCCASPSYLAKHGTPSSPHDLAKHECVIWSTKPGEGTWRFRGPEGPYEVVVRGRLSSECAEIQKTAALRGLGIALIPSFVVREELERGALRQLFAGEVIPVGPLYVTYPSSRHLAKKVRAFVDHLVARLGSAG